MDFGSGLPRAARRKYQEKSGLLAKNAKRFKLKSMRYYAQALGGDCFHYGRVPVLEYESLDDWENFRAYIEENEKAFALKEQWLTNIDVKTLRIVEWQDRQRDAWLEM